MLCFFFSAISATLLNRKTSSLETCIPAHLVNMTHAYLQKLEIIEILTLMVRSREQLGNQIICASNKRLALKLANHVVSHLFRNLLNARLYNGPPLSLFGNEIFIILIKPTFLLLDLQSLIGQLRYAVLQERRRYNGVLHLLGEARIEYRLPDDVVVSSPSRAGDVHRHFAQEPGQAKDR